MKFSLKKLQSYISEPLPAVEVLREKIIFHAFEVESVEVVGDDWELDIKVLPDRAYDAKTDLGMAREIAALLGLSLIEPDQYERGATITFSLTKMSQLLGRDISSDDIKTVFDAYHYQYDISGDDVTLFVPPWRNDLETVYDIADEIGRYLGYETISALLPEIKKTPEINPEFAAITAKKMEMIAKGYNEVMTYSLVKKGDFQVAKGPKGKDFLRTNLLGELRKAYEVNKQNIDLLGNYSARIFEIGKVFPKSGEELHIAWVDEKGEHEEMLQPLSGQESYDFSGIETSSERFGMWSEYPYITRDVAVWVPGELEAGELFEIIKQNGTELLQREPRLFDSFQKDGRTSAAFRMVFQSFDRTLTTDEVDAIMQVIYAKIADRGWEVR